MLNSQRQPGNPAFLKNQLLCLCPLDSFIFDAVETPAAAAIWDNYLLFCVKLTLGCIFPWLIALWLWEQSQPGDPPPSPRQRYSVTLRPHAWMCSMTTMMLTALLSSIKKEILKELYASELKCMYYFGVVNRWCVTSSLKRIYAQMQHQS